MNLSLHGIACERSGRPVFEGVDLELPAGGIAHLRGPNGSGKSSLLAILAGLLRPAAGEGMLGSWRLGEEGFGDLAALSGHRNALKPSLTIRENLRYWIAILGGEARKIESVLERFGLARIANTPAEQCSAGERQRAALARVTAIDRPLWLLDEPTASLDMGGRRLLGGVLRDHASRGGLAVISLHGDLDPFPVATIALDAHGPKP